MTSANRQGHHDLSHHGQDPGKIAQLKILELEKVKTLRDFLTQRRETREDRESLLDPTMVFFSSNLRDASKHSVKNMPVLLAGADFKLRRTLRVQRTSSVSWESCSIG